MFRKALVPIDGSDLSSEALRQVPRLLDPAGEALLLEVIDSEVQIMAHATPAGFPFDGGAMTVDVAERVVQAQHQDALSHLAQARSFLESEGVRSVSTRVLHGAPGHEIVALVQREGCDVVVMATHGRSGIARTFLGSVAEHVVRNLRGVPVLLIRPAEQAGPPLEAGALETSSAR
jgi:nucleotide-binding universal stress UspA family protein